MGAGLLFSARRYVARLHRLLAVPRYLGSDCSRFEIGYNDGQPKYRGTHCGQISYRLEENDRPAPIHADLILKIHSNKSLSTKTGCETCVVIITCGSIPGKTRFQPARQIIGRQAAFELFTYPHIGWKGHGLR